MGRIEKSLSACGKMKKDVVKAEAFSMSSDFFLIILINLSM